MRRRYFLKDGKTEVPGVTTLAKIGDDQEGLKNASIKLALEEGLDSNVVWKRETDIGTAVHRMIEQQVTGKMIVPETEDGPVTEESMLRTCWLCYRGWESWYASCGFKILQTETSLVSEIERFGGTFDAVLEKDGILWVADWKTSKQFGHAMMIQVAGYRGIWNEKMPSSPVQHGLIVRLSKETGRAIPRYYKSPQLDVGWAQIIRQRDLHEGRKEVAQAFKEYEDA